MAINMPHSPSPSHIITIHSFSDTLNLHLCFYQIDWCDNKCLCWNSPFCPQFVGLFRGSLSWAAPAAQPAHQWEIAFPLFKYERQILFAENITASFIAIPSNGDVTPYQRFQNLNHIHLRSNYKSYKNFGLNVSNLCLCIIPECALPVIF